MNHKNNISYNTNYTSNWANYYQYIVSKTESSSHLRVSAQNKDPFSTLQIMSSPLGGIIRSDFMVLRAWGGLTQENPGTNRMHKFIEHG